MSGEVRNCMEQGQLLGLRLVRSATPTAGVPTKGRRREAHDAAVFLANTVR
jgi:hypothetical protein